MININFSVSEFKDMDLRMAMEILKRNCELCEDCEKCPFDRSREHVFNPCMLQRIPNKWSWEETDGK